VERVFGALSLTLFAAAVATYAMIVRDALPYFSPKERAAFGHGESRWLLQLRARDHAIRGAWKLHTATFPKSRKRLLFAILLTAAALSLLGYALWLSLS